MSLSCFVPVWFDMSSTSRSKAPSSGCVISIHPAHGTVPDWWHRTCWDVTSLVGICGCERCEIEPVDVSKINDSLENSTLMWSVNFFNRLWPSISSLQVPFVFCPISSVSVVLSFWWFYFSASLSSHTFVHSLTGLEDHTAPLARLIKLLAGENRRQRQWLQSNPKMVQISGFHRVDARSKFKQPLLQYLHALCLNNGTSLRWKPSFFVLIFNISTYT